MAKAQGRDSERDSDHLCHVTRVFDVTLAHSDINTAKLYKICYTTRSHLH